MHFKHTPSLRSVSNKLDLSLPPSRFSEDITNVNDLCSQGRRRLAAVWWRPGKAFMFPPFLFFWPHASWQVPLFHSHPSLKFGKCQMIWKSLTHSMPQQTGQQVPAVYPHAWVQFRNVRGISLQEVCERECVCRWKALLQDAGSLQFSTERHRSKTHVF